MSLSEDRRSKVPMVRRNPRPTDTLGSAGVVIGIILVAVGMILEENLGVGIGAAIRTLGGVLFLGGLAVIVLWEPRRRAVLVGSSKRMVARYMYMSANWAWPDRVGLATVVIGLILAVPAIVIQILFREGAVIALPAVILFWSGVGLLIYGRFYRRDVERTSHHPPHSSRSTRGRRDRGRTRKGRSTRL